MAITNRVVIAEEDIDRIFDDSPLSHLPYCQSVWTILSVLEDMFFKMVYIHPVDAGQLAANSDTYMNMITHPLRVCHRVSFRGHYQFKKKLVNGHYREAREWIERSDHYNRFSTLFQLHHRGIIHLDVSGFNLLTPEWADEDLRYEAYDRFTPRESPAKSAGVDPLLDFALLRERTKVKRDQFCVRFCPELTVKLLEHCEEGFRRRFTLPDGWRFRCFSLAQFKSVVIHLQAIAYGWLLARRNTASTGIPGVMYSSAVWTPKSEDLVALLAASTGERSSVVASVIRYLTFGQMGIRNPDIATQPIVDLSNGSCAVSPFVLINSNSERNLCVLLNQIPSERANYSRLVDQKEREARIDFIDRLDGFQYDFKWGPIQGTDIDLAVVDHNSKSCIAVEIKWLIEPAEIREVFDKSAELGKGVEQAKKVAAAYRRGDNSLLELLGIDQSYEFEAVVGSKVFIGHSRVQSEDVPILMLWHLAEFIKETGSLPECIRWLRSRSYLPRPGHDYNVQTARIVLGKWKSQWYGFARGPGRAQ